MKNYREKRTLRPSMNTIIYLVFLCLCSVSTLQAKQYETVSPNGKLKIKLQTDHGTTYEVWYKNKQLISPSSIGLHLADGTIIGKGSIKSTQKRKVKQLIDVPIGKNKTLQENYNELTVTFKENYDLVVRAYDEGVAYRFVTRLNGEIIINDEEAIFNFASTPAVYYPECDAHSYDETDQAGRKHQIHQGYRNFERLYKTYKSPSDIPNEHFAVSPVLYEYPDSPYKLVVTESNTIDYPALYMEANGSNSMRGKWAKYPKETMDSDPTNANRWYSNHLVISRENYIARTDGNRSFPWRVIIVSENDKDLLNNELVYKLADPCRLTDISWIQPGKSAWEWWHKAVLEGVDFPNGNKQLSLQLYKYYVDWASKNHIEYMTLDAGWSDSYIKELCSYAKQKNVKILVWTWASCVREAPFDWIDKMKSHGISGVKIDFFERNDQIAMQWGKRFAERLAEKQMVGIFHGCPVPTGLNRTYPNILNYEAVRGAECNFWESTLTPEYHTRFPFIRLLAGPADYTPGSMRSVTQKEFKPMDIDNTPPMSMGTRSHELSMFIIYDQWLANLCDSPTEYNKYPDILHYLSKVPAVWDRTIPLEAKLSEYIVIAKQKGKDWYVGGMTNWSPRSVAVKLDFLKKNVSYEATLFKDAPDSNEHPQKYTKEKRVVNSQTVLNIDMAEGGGFAISLEEKTGNTSGKAVKATGY